MFILHAISKSANAIYNCQRYAASTLNSNRRYALHRLSGYQQQNKQQETLQQNRRLWAYVAAAFNKVDKERLAKVGADRLCAEWLLKNGGAVGVVGMPNRLLRDYNSLPAESVKFKVQVVDASNSSVMKIGLDHFVGCRHIDRVIFHSCKHLEEDGLEGLQHLSDTLKILQISACHNMRENSFDALEKLTALEQLRLFDFLYVSDLEGVAGKLRKALPNCKIEIGSEEKK